MLARAGVEQNGAHRVARIVMLFITKDHRHREHDQMPIASGISSHQDVDLPESVRTCPLAPPAPAVLRLPWRRSHPAEWAQQRAPAMSPLGTGK